jgi:site-specific DNA recombinase
MRYFIYCRKSSEGEERQVLSLASQQEALAKSFGENINIEIVGVYEEAKSAKMPGRPLFAEMLRRIEAGEADGIASWAPDRLARNSIDGGHIIYLLDRGVLRDLKFATYTFENNSQGKFMLGIMFNQSKYYSDALSENVKRGNATKVAMGWRPNRPPLGYLNCPTTRTIVPDPEHFPLVRRMFELFLSGAYSPRQIALVMNDEWGFLTPRKAHSGGRPLGRATIYRMLANPFYKGVLEWNGISYPGQHCPVISAKEFERARAFLKRGNNTRPARHTFTFTGLLSCGSCGHAISAEHKVNRHGSHYTYYHCAARSRLSRPCAEPSVEETTLNKAFENFLVSITISPEAAAWVRERLHVQQDDALATARQIAGAQAKARAEIDAQLNELMSLRLRRMLNDEEFARARARLTDARLSLADVPDPASGSKVFELLDIAERISNQAAKWYAKAPPDTKKKILNITCSNPTLAGKKVSIKAARPLIVRSNLSDDVPLRAVLDELRTSIDEGKALLAALRDAEANGEIATTLAAFMELERLCLDPDQSPAAQATTAVGVPSRQPRPLRSSRRNPSRMHR